MIRQLLIAAVVGLAVAAPSDKVDYNLRSVLSTKGKANVVVSFVQDTQPVLDRINSMRFATRGTKITAMKTQLEELQVSSQRNALRLLSSHSATFHSLWINNRIYIENATAELVSAIATLPEVAEVREEYVANIFEPIVESHNSTIQAEWGIDKIQAEQAWALPGGNNGQGIVVAAIDTGVRATHEALRNNQRSSYSWFDPVLNTPYPTDNSGHGTHVMGTIAGSGGIGVAPGAQWIACRGCTSGGCSEFSLSQCGQWITCPTLSNGSSPNCDMAPAVCSNSWAGVAGQTWYDSIIESWRTAGIIPVFAIGNSGPICGTTMYPGKNQQVIAVGATDWTDSASHFSARGPTDAGIVKPDISAPGSDVRSSWHTGDNAYNTICGTSMATPHVSGTVALLLARNPNMTFLRVRSYLYPNADRDLGSALTCGNTPPREFPNNIYGNGRVNARKSLEALVNDCNLGLC